MWDYGFDSFANVVDATIRRLRKAVDGGFDTPLIHTVRGVGLSGRGTLVVHCHDDAHLRGMDIETPVAWRDLAAEAAPGAERPAVPLPAEEPKRE